MGAGESSSWRTASVRLRPVPSRSFRAAVASAATAAATAARGCSPCARTCAVSAVAKDCALDFVAKRLYCRRPVGDKRRGTTTSHGLRAWPLYVSFVTVSCMGLIIPLGSKRATVFDRRRCSAAHFDTLRHMGSACFSCVAMLLC